MAKKGVVHFVFAVVDGIRRKPFRDGKGECQICGQAVTACCGEIVTHYWRHDSLADCDPWSEGITQWHLNWQDLVAEEFREVPLPTLPEKPIHRADIRTAAGKIIEFQHSFLSPEEIREREHFYGNMVWVFDATNNRFAALPSGDRVFFSLNTTKHIQVCQKPVFLDFGRFIVEVEQFTDLFDKFSGFGLKRDKRWFVESHLSDSLPLNFAVFAEESETQDRADRWPGNQKNPWRLTEFPTKWQGVSGELLVPKNTPYIPLNYTWRKKEEARGTPVAEILIERFPQIPNGWDKTELNYAKAFFDATPMILHGRLRLMPSPLKSLSWKNIAYDSNSAKDILCRADRHIAAGRLPIIKPETKAELLKRAKQNDSR